MNFLLATLQVIGGLTLGVWSAQLLYKFVLNPLTWRRAEKENLVKIRNEMERQLERPLTPEELEFLEMDWSMRMIVMREKAKGRK